MIHFFLRLLLAACCLWLSGCSLTPEELKQAERIMKTNPDSALRILERVESYQTLTDANRALYGLLYYEAMDKKQTQCNFDSLIDFSLSYYQKKEDLNNLVRCYYYKARRLKSRQQFDDATILYLKALDILPEKFTWIWEICVLFRETSKNRVINMKNQLFALADRIVHSKLAMLLLH